MVGCCLSIILRYRVHHLGKSPSSFHEGDPGPANHFAYVASLKSVAVCMLNTLVLLLLGLMYSIVQLSSLPAFSLRNFRHRDELVKEVVETKQQSSSMNTGLVLLYHDVILCWTGPFLLQIAIQFGLEKGQQNLCIFHCDSCKPLKRGLYFLNGFSYFLLLMILIMKANKTHCF